jgi:hypothetical protein
MHTKTTFYVALLLKLLKLYPNTMILGSKHVLGYNFNNFNNKAT